MSLPLLPFNKFAAIAAPQFEIGTATAAFQIEGSAESPGRSPSIWDDFHGAEQQIAGIGCDHLQRWQQDIDLIKALNLDCYRLSISWGRVISDPQGTVNSDGIAFYRAILHKLKQLGIRAVVTLFHWDLPNYWQQQGGWSNRDTAIGFAKYAEVVAQQLGEWIDTIYTINEPWVIAFLGHREGVHAPGIKDEQTAYRTVHHLLLGHGLACTAIKQSCHNKVGIVLNGGPVDPDIWTQSDIEAADYHYQEGTELFIKPVLQGSYPVKILEHKPHLLPEGWQQDLTSISQPIDRLGLNYYCRYRHSAKRGPQTGAEPLSTMGWEVSPLGLYRWLTKLNQHYQLPPIEITENGIALADQYVNGQIDDQPRWDYIQQHLIALDAAICDGIDVRSYFVWTLLDNFEWAEGYSQTFGIVHVDRATQQRTLKQSAKALRDSLALRNRYRASCF